MAKSNDQDHFPRLFVQSQRRIYGFILTVVTDSEVADDVFQETSLILWKRAADFTPQADFVRWACGIAMNVIRNRRVKRPRDRHIFSDAMLEEIAAARQNHGSWLDQRMALLTHCLSRLSEGQRQMLHSVYSSLETVTDIAETQGISENSLYQRLHRIRRRLFECISELERKEAAP